MGECIIETHNLMKRFGTRTILNGIDLCVQAGEFLVLFGSNGVGKSTLIRILCTLMKPSSGTAKVAGHDIAEDPDGVRANVALLGHSTHLYDNLTALENLHFYLRLHGADSLHLRADQALKVTGLEHAQHQQVRLFSAGMKKRLGIAKVMASPPRLLFLDEPYSSLDEEGIQMLNRFLRGLQADGGTIFMVTHHREQGLATGDRILALERGRLQAAPLSRQGA
jgi:heme exporter protein A